MPGIPNRGILDSIRASCLYAVGSSTDVSVSERALEDYASSLSVEAVVAASQAVGLPVRFPNLHAEVNFLALLALLSFGSEYDSLLVESSERDAHEIIQFGLLGMHITGSSLDAQQLKEMSNFNIASYFGIVSHRDEQLQAGILISRPGPLLPFVQRLKEVMNETGRRVEELGFTSLGELILDIMHRSPEGSPSAAFLVQELTNSIPGMSDVAGTTERVAFHAQAQNLAHTLHCRFGQTHPNTFHFEDAGKLTGDSGRETLKALHSQGILAVEGNLAEAIEAGPEYPDNGLHVVELRASAVVAVDRIVECMQERGVVTAQQISSYLKSIYQGQGSV